MIIIHDPIMLIGPTAGSGGSGGGSVTLSGDVIGANPTRIVSIGAVPARGYRPINAQTVTSYTLLSTDNGKLITMSNSSSSAIGITFNSDVPFPIGAEIDVVQLGTGSVEIEGYINIEGGEVNIYSYAGKGTLAGQYAGATLKKIGTDSWFLVGNLV